MKNLKNILAVTCISIAIIGCEKEDVAPVEDANNPVANTKGAQAAPGVGGSLAQFTIVDEYLYTIDYKTLNIFSLGNPDMPSLSETISMGVGMETVFHQDGYLYIGANDGVHIYDISNPRNPQEVSDYEHVTSCDPVVANGNIAVATLRGGTECGGNLSQLDVIDISNIYNPELVGEVELSNPYGLGFSSSNADIVYVCDGYDGLKAFDVSDISNPQLIMIMSELEPLDIISTADNNLIVLTTAGVHQFDASNPTQLVQKSVIQIQ